MKHRYFRGSGYDLTLAMWFRKVCRIMLYGSYPLILLIVSCQPDATSHLRCQFWENADRSLTDGHESVTRVSYLPLAICDPAFGRR